MSNFTVPAYPVMPIQDNFKRLVVPVPGITKLEHFVLEIFKARLSNNFEDQANEIMSRSITDALILLEKLEEKTKQLNNEKPNEKPIFDY
jgi:hypothetical protein